ncbi:MAG: hypothetical protein Q8P18_14885 [Pseudomonadota bacterium]|nr:hypothetical protein [Pseudomonadota bacterium]
MHIFLLAAALADDLPDPKSDPGHDILIPAPDQPETEQVIRLTDAEKRDEAASLYVKGLDAWKAGKHSRAWRLATEALVLDPDLTPARLLAGYALLRLRRTSEGVTTLEGLDLEPDSSPLPAETRRASQRLLRRHESPYRRDQWWVAVGTLTFLERLGDTVVPLNGYVFTGQAPIVGKLALRVEGGAPWSGGEALDIRGPHFDVMAVVAQPVDKGLWHVDLAAGPAFWIAEGRYWADGWEPYFGVRAAIGVDVRLGASIGLRYEMGASAFPMADDDLPFYGVPLDLRLAIQTWFGR